MLRKVPLPLCLYIRSLHSWMGTVVIYVQVGEFTEFRCKANAAQLVPAGLKGPAHSVDNRCWARTGHTVTQASSPTYDKQGVLHFAAKWR